MPSPVVVPSMLDEHNRQELKIEVLKILEEGEDKVILDFSQTKVVSSAGLGLLIILNKKLTESGSSLILTNLNQDLRNLLSMTKIDRLLKIEESQEL